MSFKKIIYTLPLFIISLIFFIQYINLNYFGAYEKINNDQIKIIFKLPSERDSLNKEFIWLTENRHYITIQNTTDQEINAVLNLKLRNNPCKVLRRIKFTNLNLISKQEPIYSDIPANILIPIKLAPFHRNVIAVSPIYGETCTVSNGDIRVFVAKLSHWKVIL